MLDQIRKLSRVVGMCCELMNMTQIMNNLIDKSQ